MSSTEPTPWFTPLPDGRVQCDLCPRQCRLHAGQRGFCYVRKEEGGAVVLDSYGRASGFCVDPIEKKPLNHFFPGSSVLSFGTAGCNLGCRFCQNWAISKAKQDDALTDLAMPDAIARAAENAGCKSIAFTYNDPVIFAEYAIDCAHSARERGLRSVAVTAGYISQRAREAFFAPMDAVNVDLKAFSEEFYERQCYGQLGPVLDTLCFLAEPGRPWFEITTLLIEGLNDSDGEIDAMCTWLLEHVGDSVPLHLTAFHPDFKLRDRPGTSASTLLRARERALGAGLRYVYAGNVVAPESQSTRCAKCSNPLIGRDGYRLTAWNLKEGRCTRCDHVLPGHFDARPGTWGARRHRLHVAEFA